MRLKSSMKFGIAVSETRGRSMKFTDDTAPHLPSFAFISRHCPTAAIYTYTVIPHSHLISSHLTQPYPVQ